MRLRATLTLLALTLIAASASGQQPRPEGSVIIDAAEDNSFESASSDFTVKFTHTFRF